MSNEKVAHESETTNAPESGQHVVAHDYVSAEARTLERHKGHWSPFAEIHKSTLGDLLPLLFDGDSSGKDLADAALHSIREDLEILCLAAEEMESYDVVRTLIKLQDRATVASELHRRIKSHGSKSEPERVAPAQAGQERREPSEAEQLGAGHECVDGSGEFWTVRALERAFHGLREAFDHMQILLVDAQKDEPPGGIEECAAATLEDVARWSLDFRTNLDAVRGQLNRLPEAKRVAS